MSLWSDTFTSEVNNSAEFAAVEHLKTNYCPYRCSSLYENTKAKTQNDCLSTVWWLSPPQPFVLQLNFPYKKPLLTKALHKNPQQEEVHPIALGATLQYNLDFISQQTRLFNIPHHKWNIFCALPDELVSALWFDSRVLLLHLHAKHTDETAAYHQVTAVVIHQGFMLSANIRIINPDEVPAASLCIAWNDINCCQ